MEFDGVESLSRDTIEFVRVSVDYFSRDIFQHYMVHFNISGRLSDPCLSSVVLLRRS